MKAVDFKLKFIVILLIALREMLPLRSSAARSVSSISFATCALCWSLALAVLGLGGSALEGGCGGGGTFAIAGGGGDWKEGVACGGEGAGLGAAGLGGGGGGGFGFEALTGGVSGGGVLSVVDSVGGGGVIVRLGFGGGGGGRGFALTASVLIVSQSKYVV